MLVFAIIFMVTVTGCAGLETDPSDGNSNFNGEPATADESGNNESVDGDPTDCTEASNEENDPDAGAVPDESAENENTETNESTVEQTSEVTLEIHAIDVGQADATLLIGPEETMLIDSGGWRDNGE